MLFTVAVVVPGRLGQRTGGSLYNRRMVDGLRARGWAVDVHELHDSFPFATPDALQQAAHVLGSIRDGTLTVIDGLACGAIPDIVEVAASRLRIVALVHLPLAADIGLTADEVAQFEQSERRTLHAVGLVIVTGHLTRALMAAHGLTHDRVVTVEPGTDNAPLARGSGGPRVSLLSVATLNAGKGHELLLEALARLPHRQWQLVCAGSATRHPATAERVRTTVARLGLDDHVSLVGELGAPALSEAYNRADLFVLATLRETYGMAVAEALARGLPVVSTATGAIPTLVGEDAGLVVPVGDTAALTAALSRVIADEALRARLAAGARVVRGRLPDWNQACTAFAAALQTIDTHE